MYKADLNSHVVSEKHYCEASRVGDWIIHRCPKCDYELWDNWRTGELKIINSKTNVAHSGFYVPFEIRKSIEN